MAQRYQANIESLENLQYVANVVDGFNQDRFLAALMGKKFISKAELKQMRFDLAEINIKLYLCAIAPTSLIGFNNPETVS